MSEMKAYDWDYDARLPAGLYDVAANETWLEEMAARGYVIQRVQGVRVYFVKSEAKTVRCRMQPFRKKGEKMDEERIGIYRDLGWEHVDSVAGLYHLWRCEDPSAPELDTDPVVQAEGYRYLKRSMVRTAAIELSVVAGVLFLCLFMTAGGGTALRNALRDSLPLQLLALTVAIGCAIPWEVMEVLTMRRLLRRLETGIPLERPRLYKKKQWVQRGMTYAFIIYFILNTINTFWPVGNGDILGWSAMDEDAPKAGMVYVDVTELEPPDDVVEFDFAITKFHELAPRVTQVQMQQLHQVSPGHYLVTANADTTYYDLRFQCLAPVLVNDIRCTYRNWEPFEEVNSLHLDRFLITDHTGRGNIAIAVKGKRVMELFYSGQTDLRTLDVYLAELLKQ